MQPKYQYGKQFIDQEDLDALISTAKSDFLTQGPKVNEFENTVSNYVGSDFSVAVNSATSALHIACIALGLKEGDILWTSSLSFVASANCGRYCGASVDFVDINAESFNISLNKLSDKLSKAAKSKLLPKILVVVHMCGNPAEMKEINKLCSQYNIKIIEDASHALGAQFCQEKIGSCKYSDLTVFSFHPVKMITTGEGGIISVNDKDLYQTLIRLRSHGITRDSEEMNELHGPWYYEQQMLGFNYRMTDLSAALGISQLKKISNFVSKRNNLANIYKDLLDDTNFDYQIISSNRVCSYHLFVAQLKKITDQSKLVNFFKLMLKDGIQLNLHYIPIHLQPYYKDQKKYNNLSSTENYYQRSFSLPMYYELEEEDIQYICEMANKNFMLIK